jgi:hypothetical protein
MPDSNQPFTYSKNNGENVLTGGLLVPGAGNIEIKGDTISGITGGKTTSITCVEQDGIIYKWEVVMTSNDAGKTYYFTDASPDTYKLGVSSPIVENHEVSYNSDAPQITKITWS